MATLNDKQITEMWKDVFRKNVDKDVFKAGTSLTLPQLKAAFQAIEDFWQTNKVSLKGQMDAAAGATLTADQSKALGKAWLKKMAERGNN